jgi:hypothetical protein
MKLIKVFGLAMVAAVAAMAFVGAGSASAEAGTVALCKKPTLTCAATDQYPAGTVITASLKPGTKAVLTGGLKVECEVSNIKITTEGASLGSSILGKVTEALWNKCSGCTEVKSLGIPWLGHLTSLGNLVGLLNILSPKVLLSKCAFGAGCIAESPEVSLEVDTASQPATVLAINEPLKLSADTGTFCPASSGTWNATYEVLSPTPLYVES